LVSSDYGGCPQQTTLQLIRASVTTEKAQQGIAEVFEFMMTVTAQYDAFRISV